MNSCEEQLKKLKKQLTQLLIANGEQFVKQTKVRNNNFVNAPNTFTRNTLIREYGFSPKIAGIVAGKLKTSKRLPNEYSKTTGKLKTRI